MNDDTCEVCAALPSNTVLYETESWVASLNANQAYLGRCYVTLKQHKGDLAELSSGEWLEFADLVKIIESAIRKTFGSTLFNWSCLMNNAFQTNPARPHVHWHLRPRYEHSVEFNGITFSDVSFGHHYDRTGREQLLQHGQLDAINNAIRSNIG